MPEPTPPAPPAPAAAPVLELPAAGPDEVALLIDERPVVVKKGTTVLQAAERLGVAVPHYCYHPGLTIAGNCRMCFVEIEKMPKLQIGCATQATQGMVVRTANPRVKAARESIMEFLLINHPLDCPICDQAGECRLQQYANAYGRGQSRFVEEKIHNDKGVPIGPRVVFDGERCIKCTRCIRFCDEVSKTHELGLFERGGHAIIGTFPGKSLDNNYSGNTVDICPVGALTWKPFRFRARVWFLRNVPSVCTGCARGCNVELGVYDHRIHRITPRRNDAVNGYWMCDLGRQTYERLDDRPRLERPTVHAPGGPAATGAAGTAAAGAVVPAPEAVDRAAALLRETAARHGAGSLAAIVSARLTLEDLFMARLALKQAGIARVVVPPHETGEDDDLLLRRDKTPNARGAALVGLGRPDAAATARLAGDIAAGHVRGLVVVGEDPVGDGYFKADLLSGLDALVVIDAWQTATAQAAHVALPATGPYEADGVVVNFQGRAQRLRRGVPAPALAEPSWRWLRELGRRFGLAGSWSTASAVFDHAAADLKPLASLTWRGLGGDGHPVVSTEAGPVSDRTPPGTQALEP
ncbi:MAG TPA: 2Fe-2S iron-sulfur cluster-binding protein [Candidatus Polarisedimenticolia bacterium]|nr:2Fe-2S iron-sulfur cluster-binding protein [Candidatus Polarisedimenticolia bacterium]